MTMENEPEFDQDHVLVAGINSGGLLECPRCTSSILTGNPAHPWTEKVDSRQRTSPAGTYGPWQRLHFQCEICHLYFALFIGSASGSGVFFHVIPVAGQGFGKDLVFDPTARRVLGKD